MPFLIRSIPSNGNEMMALTLFIHQMGWRNFGVIVEPSYVLQDYGVLRDHAAALHLTITVEFYFSSTQSAEHDVLELDLLCQMIRDSGTRVMVILGIDLHGYMAKIFAAAQRFDLTGPGHVWFGNSAGFNGFKDITDWTNLFGVRALTQSAQMDVYKARWKQLCTVWDPKLHGDYDPSTGLPFYGANLLSDILWDTGDSDPDYWGNFVYDCVWIIASAMRRLLDRGVDPVGAGRQLRDEILTTDMNGITGRIIFDLKTQDRVGLNELLFHTYGSWNVVATTTFNITATKDGLQECLMLDCTTLTPMAIANIPWDGGFVPHDGRAVDAKRCSVSGVPTSLAPNTQLTFAVSVRNAFSMVPCASEAFGPQCLQQFAKYDLLELTFANGELYSVSTTINVTRGHVDFVVSKLPVPLTEPEKFSFSVVHGSAVIGNYTITINALSASRDFTLIVVLCIIGAAMVFGILGVLFIRNQTRKALQSTEVRSLSEFGVNTAKMAVEVVDIATDFLSYLYLMTVQEQLPSSIIWWYTAALATAAVASTTSFFLHVYSLTQILRHPANTAPVESEYAEYYSSTERRIARAKRTLRSAIASTMLLFMEDVPMIVLNSIIIGSTEAPGFFVLFSLIVSSAVLGLKAGVSVRIPAMRRKLNFLQQALQNGRTPTALENADHNL
eukprot:TRINITY_DN20851_c0_g1_i2.p1 TRINITY_DN20851_c0_g1~~TRINITY_DN20851_c0_g1_i2.p1  ORF type:complete len:670 (+),score=108.66 TRINITY_DN20851_c0_g1_i2:461-2470(+)